jgi:hypothetical protein
MIEKKNIQDAYKFYKGMDEKPVNLATYRAIVNGFMKFIMKKVLLGFEVQLSTYNTLGRLYIGGTKHEAKIVEITKEDGSKDVIIKHLPPDWGTTRKLWTKKAEAMGLTFKQYVEQVPSSQREVVYHTNESTNGMTYSFRWSTYKVKLPNKFYYSLIFSRANKRSVKPALQTGAEFL